mmetsp:Transcript_5035/g.10938  ORF Transcript_5035/g.10938 Transcript_5035/m.10938 type:complete len:213 (-) Transcript_5035:1183-1821(-)
MRHRRRRRGWVRRRKRGARLQVEEGQEGGGGVCRHRQERAEKGGKRDASAPVRRRADPPLSHERFAGHVALAASRHDLQGEHRPARLRGPEARQRCVQRIHERAAYGRGATQALQGADRNFRLLCRHRHRLGRPIHKIHDEHIRADWSLRRRGDVQSKICDSQHGEGKACALSEFIPERMQPFAKDDNGLVCKFCFSWQDKALVLRGMLGLT